MDPKRSLRQEGRPRSAALLAPLLLIALCLVIAGCGGGADSSTQGAGETQGTSAAQGAERSSHSAEASIEGFGEEAKGAERQAILKAFTDYQEAIAQKDYASACSHMDAEMHEALAQFVGKKKVDCAKVLPALVSPEAAAVARGQLQGTVTKIRAQGGRGFVVFKAPGAKLYDMAMSEEGGEWKVASSAAGVLVPEL